MKKRERNVIIILLILCTTVTLFNIFLQKNESKPLENQTFEGKFLKEIILDDNYSNKIYENEGKEISYIYDNKNKHIIDNLDLIKKNKKDDFDQKTLELLNLKYPAKVSDILHSACEKKYFFFEHYLLIQYTKNAELRDYQKDFSLIIDYNEIKDYLIIKPVLNREYENESGYEYDKNKVTFALTFDDGPNGDKTKELINILEDYKMSATFFMVGNKLSKQKETVKFVYDSHSEVGYHSYKHEYFTKQSIEELKSDFEKTNNIFKEITGSNLFLTRPPYGSSNEKILNALNTAFIRWNIDTLDWKYKDPQYLSKYVLDNFYDGAIILLHDTYSTSIEATKTFVEELYKKDVQVVSISELASLKDITLENHKLYTKFTN